MARAPEVGERVPSVCKGQVIPQTSPHRVGVCVSERLAGQRAAYRSMWRPLGTDSPPGFPLSSHGPGHINIYLGKAEVN